MGISSAVGWINLTTCVSSGVSALLVALPFRLTEGAAPYGLDPQLVSSWLSHLGGRGLPPMRGALPSESSCPTVRGPSPGVSTTQESAMSRGFQRRPGAGSASASGTSFATPKPYTRLKYPWFRLR